MFRLFNKKEDPADYVFRRGHIPGGSYLFDDGTFGYIADPEFDISEFIDFEDGNVAEVARTIRLSTSGRCDLVKRTYEYVRDQVSHSYDAGLHTPAAKASEVLRAGGASAGARRTCSPRCSGRTASRPGSPTRS